MSRPNKRAIIQQILYEYGYHGWYIVLSHMQDPASSGMKCILFNFKQRMKAEIVIPNHWFQDPRRPMGELIALAIQNSRPFVSKSAADNYFFFLSDRPNQSTGDQKDGSIPDAQESPPRRKA